MTIKDFLEEYNKLSKATRITQYWRNEIRFIVTEPLYYCCCPIIWVCRAKGLGDFYNCDYRSACVALGLSIPDGDLLVHAADNDPQFITDKAALEIRNQLLA